MYSKLFDYHLQSEPHFIIWVKESFVMRQLGYHSQFEVIYFGWKGSGGGAKYWFGDRLSSDVWQIRRDLSPVHPTQKPVEACALAIRNSCPPGGVVYEPFAGSGSTLIGAEMEGRRCFAMELDPGYCDVIRQRYADFTGRPELAP
jgi:DNA modification methylase